MEQKTVISMNPLSVNRSSQVFVVVIHISKLCLHAEKRCNSYNVSKYPEITIIVLKAAEYSNLANFRICFAYTLYSLKSQVNSYH